MKHYILILISILGVYSCSLSQEPLNFKKFTLVDYNFSAGKDILPKDSFMIKRYVLSDSKGDTFYIFQRVPFDIRNGNIKIYEVGLTERFVNLQKGSCYDICLQKDVNQLLNNPDYRKHRKIEFIYKEKGKKLRDEKYFKNFILVSIIQCSDTL